MIEKGIFPIVAEAIQAEITSAAAALAPWGQLAPTPLLLGLCDVLQGQVAALQTPAGT